ncbi:MAG: hypothetical protein ACE5DK_07355 [Paracoccaceae bacterium]
MLINLGALRLAIWLISGSGVAGVIAVVAGFAILLWQVVGGVRTAERVMRETGDLLKVVALYAGVLLVILVALAQAVDIVVGRAPIPAGRVGAPVAMLDIDQTARMVRVDGTIDYPLNTALRATIAANPSLRVVLLNSDGGSIFAARALAATIENARLQTRVEGHCYSACTIAFMAGTSRTLGPEGHLGFHRYQFDSDWRVQTLDVGEQEALDRAFFASRGVSGAFLDRVNVTAPSAIWVPTTAELLEGGVISELE